MAATSQWPRIDKKKTVEIVWQVPESKERQVTVNGVPAFRQSTADFAGHFVSSFAHLVV